MTIPSSILSGIKISLIPGVFSWSAALSILSHGCDLAKVLRPALGGFLAADATRIGGNQRIFNGAFAPRALKHIRKLEQALLFVKRKGGELST